MINLKKNSLVFLIVLIQTAAAITSGFMALYLFGMSRISPATFVESVDIGNLTTGQATDKLRSFYSGWAGKQKLAVKIEGESREFNIDLDSIKADVDYKKTINNVNGNKMSQSFYKLLNGYFMAKKTVFAPSVAIDDSALKAKLKEIASFIYKEPVDARIYLKDGKIVKIPGANGKKLNIDNAVNKIKTELSTGYKQKIDFNFSDGSELEELLPIARNEDLTDIEDIISTYSTEIKAVENLDSIKKSVSAVNSVLIKAFDHETGEQAGVFSFNKYLNLVNLLKDQNDEGYNQVASTLNAAVIYAGIDPKGISRIQHKSTVDYIEPGLDVRVFGGSEDYKFRNSLDNNIVIFVEIKDNKIVVNLVGKKKNEAVNNKIQIDIVDKKAPATVKVEDSRVKKGKTVLLSQGIEGLKANVYSIVDGSGGQEKKLLYTNEYQPRDTVVQVAPGERTVEADMK